MGQTMASTPPQGPLTRLELPIEAADGVREMKEKLVTVQCGLAELDLQIAALQKRHTQIVEAIAQAQETIRLHVRQAAKNNGLDLDTQGIGNWDYDSKLGVLYKVS